MGSFLKKLMEKSNEGDSDGCSREEREEGEGNKRKRKMGRVICVSFKKKS